MEIGYNPKGNLQSTNNKVNDPSSNEIIHWYRPIKSWKRGWYFRTGGKVLPSEKEPTKWNVIKHYGLRIVGGILIGHAALWGIGFAGLGGEWSKLDKTRNNLQDEIVKIGVENNKYILEGTISEKDSKNLLEQAKLKKEYGIDDFFNGIVHFNYRKVWDSLSGIYQKHSNPESIVPDVNKIKSQRESIANTNKNLKSGLDGCLESLEENYPANIDNCNDLLTKYEQAELDATKYKQGFEQLGAKYQKTVEIKRIKNEKAKLQAKQKAQKNAYCNGLYDQMINIVKECSNKGCTLKQKNGLAVKARVYFETNAKGKCTDRKSEIYRKVSRSLDYRL